MIDNFLFRLILGHLVGDYLLQNNWQALNKSRYDKLGWFSCIIHCLLYTLAVCFMTANFSWQWMTFIFTTHFVPDKFSWAEKYLRFIKGRSLVEFVKDYQDMNMTAFLSLKAGFSAIVFVIVDNTIHLLLVYAGILWVGGLI